jgi:hypothetical protein
MILPLGIILGREIFQTKFVEEIKIHIVLFNKPSSENGSLYEIMWKSMIEPAGHR